MIPPIWADVERLEVVGIAPGGDDCGVDESQSSTRAAVSACLAEKKARLWSSFGGAFYVVN
jgi:hypothetical protein